MRRRSIVAGCLSIVLATLAASSLRADSAASVRIAVLDVERVRSNAAAVKAIRTQLGSYLDVYRNDTQKEEQQLRAAQDELSGKRAGLSPEGYSEERKKLEERLDDAQGRVQRRRQALERINTQAMEQVKQSLEAIVIEIASERQLALILRKDQAVFVAPAIEITDDVLKRLDQRMPTIKIADPGG